MRTNEVIAEIEYALDIQPYNPDITNAKYVGTMQHRDIFMIEDHQHEIYIMTDEDNSTTMAYVALNKSLIDGYYPINQMENITGTGGAITSIMGFLVSNLKYKLTFSKKEPLTHSGLQWLINLLKHNGRGFTVTDNTGNFPNIEYIKDEWNASMTSHVHTGTISIFLENNGILPGIKEEGLIKSPYRILFDKRFL